MMALSIDTLNKLLIVDAEKGKLYWRERPLEMFSATGKYSAERAAAAWNGRYAGSEALAADHGDGYLAGNILRKSHLAHRVIWAMHYGQWPEHQIDHDNHNTSDNRIKNLNDVTGSKNQRNAKQRVDNKTGITGVFIQGGKYKANIQYKGAQKHLGTFNCITAAMIARKLAEQKYNFHPNHGMTP